MTFVVHRKSKPSEFLSEINQRRASQPMVTDMKLITVVIPIRNEAKHIGAVLDALLVQNYPKDRFEIIVVDGLSEDDSKMIISEYVKNFPNIRLLDNPKRLSSAARNIGVREARGEIILIVDGHCLIDNRQMFANVNASMQDQNVHSLGRPQPLFLDNANAAQRAIAMARHSRLGHHPDSFIYSDEPQKVPAISVAVAYRKNVFGQVGLFDERFDVCEDCELNYRLDLAGFHCYFVPDIAVRYVPRDSVFRLGKQMIRYGRGRVRLAKKHPKTFSLKMFMPALLVLGLIAGGLLSFFSMPVAFVYGGVIAVYFAVIALESVRLSVVNRFLPGLILLPVVFLTIHLASGYGELVELFSRLKSEYEVKSKHEA